MKSYENCTLIGLGVIFQNTDTMSYLFLNFWEFSDMVLIPYFKTGFLSDCLKKRKKPCLLLSVIHCAMFFSMHTH